LGYVEVFCSLAFASWPVRVTNSLMMLRDGKKLSRKWRIAMKDTLIEISLTLLTFVAGLAAFAILLGGM
jgi:hypothetical protein